MNFLFSEEAHISQNPHIHKHVIIEILDYSHCECYIGKKSSSTI